MRSAFTLLPDELIRFASAILKTIARISGWVEQPPDMGMFQQRYVKRHAIYNKPDIDNQIRVFAAPKIRHLQAANFGGLANDRILGAFAREIVFPYSLICCQDTTAPFAIASNNISRSFAARGAV